MLNFNKEAYGKLAVDFENWWEHKLERPIIQVTLTDSGKSAGGDFFSSNYRRDILNALYDMNLPVADAVQAIEKAYSTVTFLGDAFPVFYMRPTGVLGGFLGQEFGIDHNLGTVWFKKTGQDLEEASEIKLDDQCPLFARAIALTEQVQNHFDGALAVGVPDLGGVYDVLASIVDANELLLALYTEPDEVKKAAWNIFERMVEALGRFQSVIRPDKVPGYTCWATMLSQKPYYVLQNDFSAMISAEMFDEFYMPILRKECESVERTVYHLDGPGAVRHIDSILSIESLNGLQWVNGAGAPGLDQWPDIYRKTIAAGKLCQVFINNSDELRFIDDIADIVGSVKGFCFICTGDLAEKDKFMRYMEKYKVI